jgi:predicted TIM-barrel fold metal-dependent hydrolase
MNFVAAHMGGLLADFEDLRRELAPAPNLYLDTSNAAHTLCKDQFTELLRMHGSSNILFGTDWPWFVQISEKELVGSLMMEAGYDQSEQVAVYGGNAARLFGFQQEF